jgi:prepilin-type processing-associated H-X9-DG protein
MKRETTMKRHVRRGFTLFQLLIVLGILAVGFSLFLPALAKARVAAARAQSQNNLKQIGLACHNYYSAFNVFPPGCNAQNFSTAVHILPFIEQNNVYKLIDQKKPVDDKANAMVRGVIIKTFINPMDPVQKVDDNYGPTNYLFNAGSKPDLADNDGIFYLDSKIKFPDITDGTSNTLFTGETLKGDGGKKGQDVRRQYVLLKKEDLKGIKDDAGTAQWKEDQNIAGDRCASWMDGRFLQGTFTGTRALNDAKPDVSCAGAGGLSGLRSLGEGANVGFADGSVRFISQSVKPNIWKLLTSRNDGLPLPPDF